MKAFLSHSSKDKSLVRQIADKLGPTRCEYDEYSFEYTLNAQAIRQAFARADLFVLFLSENSTKSTFVNEEIRTALNFRAQGTIKKVIIFPLDATSYRELPDWLRATNVVIRLQRPLTIFRKIEAELFALEVENSGIAPVLIPRAEEEQALRTALSLPPGQSPVALHIVGHIGIGRRTLLRETLKRVFPRKIQTFIPIVLGKFEGANEFYRRLYELFVK
jgi:TIR domain